MVLSIGQSRAQEDGRVVARGPSFTVHERVTSPAHADGVRRDRTNRFTLLENGYATINSTHHPASDHNYPPHTTLDLAQGTVQTRAAFALASGSYFGDFDSTNNILRALLTCPEGALAAACSLFVNWDLNAVALGHPLGNALLETVNGTGLGEDLHAYVALLGDPTLRLNMHGGQNQ